MSNSKKNKSGNKGEIKRRSAAIFDAQSRKSAGPMGDRRKKRSKERENIMDGW